MKIQSKVIVKLTNHDRSELKFGHGCGIRETFYGIRGLTAKPWKRNGHGCGIGKENDICDSDDKFGMRDSREKGVGMRYNDTSSPALF